MQITAIAAAVALAVGFAAGWSTQGWRKDAELLAITTAAQEAAQVAREQAEAREAATELAQRAGAALAAERQKRLREFNTGVQDEVIRYVQTPVAAKCGVDAGGVRLIDAAARGVPEGATAAAAPDDRARDASAARVVASVTSNYATCHETREQLLELQGWVRGLDYLR